ncbi:MAG: hypothetical protein E5X63_24950, partial [Mesorhizobium sp.]
MADILIAVVDCLKGFAEPIGAVFPQTVVQTGIVHLIRQIRSCRLRGSYRPNTPRPAGPRTRPT